MTENDAMWVSRCTECKHEFARPDELVCAGCGTRRARSRAWVAFVGENGTDSDRIRLALDEAFNDLQRDGHVEITLILTEKKTWLVEHARGYAEPSPTPDTGDPGVDARFRVLEVLTGAGIAAEA